MATSTCLYGDPKVGKSLAVIFAAWDAAFVGPKDTAILEPAQAMLGYKPPFCAIQLIGHIIPAAVEAKKRGFQKLAVDDLTHLANNTEAFYKAQFTGGNRYAPWNAFRADFQQMLNVVCNQLGMSIWFTAHEKAPQDERTAENGQTKKALRGGPRLPLGMQEDLPAFMDHVYRVQHSQAAPRGLIRFGWPYVLRSAGADADYVTGDRSNVVPDCANLNLGEAYREAGHGEQFRRPPPWHDWIESAVNHYVGPLMKAEKDAAAASAINAELVARGREAFKGDVRPVEWALNDLSARAYLKLHGRRADPFQAWTGLGNLSSVPVVASAVPAPDLGGGAPAVPLNGAAPTTPPLANPFAPSPPNVPS